MDEASGIHEQATDELHSEDEPRDMEAELAKLKQEARKWEARAKENKLAADELAAIKAERMTEQEKLTARAEQAEARVAELTAAAARNEAADRISKDKGVPRDLLMFCADEDAMERFAESYAERPTVPSAPSAPASRIVRDENAQVSNRDQFAADMANFMKR